MAFPPDQLARFAREFATAGDVGTLQELLVDTAADLVGAGAAVLVGLDAAGKPHVAAARGFDEAKGLALAPDDLGEDLGARLVAASHGRFSVAQVLPLVAGGGLHGLLVLLDAHAEIAPDALEIAAALVDIVAARLSRTRDLEELERAYDELKHSREALAHGEKLRVLGGMSAGIAHDLKNVIAALMMQNDILSRSDFDADELRAHIKEMRRPLENGLKIVERLRKFSRASLGEEKEVADLDVIAEDAVALARPRATIAPTRVHIALQRGDPPPVRVDVAEAVAAVGNLVVNAVDALAKDGGTITVRTRAHDKGAAIDVEDDGPGIPADVKARLFEAFFTTKGAEGTGLGLAMVKDFAQRHGGTIDVESEPGKGARFTLWFPAARLA